MPKAFFFSMLCVSLAACAAASSPAVHKATAASYPEGPVVTDDGLLFVEFSRDRVMRWQGSQATQVWHSPGCGPAGLAVLPNGSAWIACHTRHRLLRVHWAHPAQVLQAYDIPYPNDVALDGHGGVYITASGMFDPAAPVCGEIYYLDAGGTLSRVATNIHYSNGIALSHDGKRLRVSEHLQNRVRTYHIDGPGTLSGEGPTTDLSAYTAHPQSADEALLGPDGLGIDANGHLWVAHYAGGRLLHLSGDDSVQSSVSFAPPFINVTNVAPQADGRVFVTLTSDNANAGHPGAVVNLHPAAFESKHMHCTVDPPRVTCVPR